jgi:hypothetical protein
LLGAYALLSAVFALSVLMLRALLGPSSAVTAVSVALLMTVTGRHLVWILSGADFPRLLRRSDSDPYRTLGLLALLDLIALLAIAILLLRWGSHDAFRLQWVPEEARDLLSLRHLTQLPHRAKTSVPVVLIALAAAAYYASLASQLYKWSAFRRDGDDLAWMSALRLLDRDVDGAKRTVDLIPRDHISGPTIQARIRVALATDRFDEALRLSRLLGGLLEPDEASPDAALVYLAVEAWSAPLTDEGCSRILEQAQFAAVSNAAMIVIEWKLATLTKERLSALAPTADTGTADEAAWWVTVLTWNPELVGKSWFDSELLTNDLVDVLEPLAPESMPRWLRAFLVEVTWRLDQIARRARYATADRLHDLRRGLVLLPRQVGEATLTDAAAASQDRWQASRTGLDYLAGNL